MSQNNIYGEKEQISYYSQNLNNINNSYPNSINNKKEINLQNNYSYQSMPYISNYPQIGNNNAIQSQNIDNNYIKDRYAKIKEENAILKKKLFQLEKDYKIQKGQIEEKILILRDENSNLQMQLQKAIEKQKDAYKNSDNLLNEKNILLNKLNIIQNDSNALKDNITKKNAEIEEKIKIINDLLNEKNIIAKERKLMKNQIQNLNKDKEILIKQIQDLNCTIGEKIAPKLKQNENNLVNLQEQIENLRINNEKYKSDNTLLFNENKIQKNLIKILTKQNKKLLGEIRIIYDRDILLMDNMEKIGSNSSENFKKFYNKNQNLFEEEMNILKQSQKYIDDDEENEKENIFNNSEENEEKNNNNLNTLEVNEEDIPDNIIKDINENKNSNNFIYKNRNKRNDINNNIINNEIIIKRNKESIDQINELNNINNNNRNISNKNLYNNNLTDDINNEKLKLQNSNDTENLKINSEIINKYNTFKEKKSNKNKNNNIKNQHLDNKKIETYNTDNNNKIKLQSIDDDIKTENKLFNSEEINNTNEKNRFTNNFFYHYNNNEIINNDYMYSTDGKINIKSNNNLEFGKSEKNLTNNENVKKFDTEINNKKKEINLNNQNSINFEENNNNILFHSQAKSLLSEYVEDLDVIQYK